MISYQTGNLTAAASARPCACRGRRATATATARATRAGPCSGAGQYDTANTTDPGQHLHRPRADPPRLGRGAGVGAGDQPPRQPGDLPQRGRRLPAAPLRAAQHVCAWATNLALIEPPLLHPGRGLLRELQGRRDGRTTTPWTSCPGWPIDRARPDPPQVGAQGPLRLGAAAWTGTRTRGRLLVGRRLVHLPLQPLGRRALGRGLHPGRLPARSSSTTTTPATRTPSACTPTSATRWPAA